MRVTVFVNRGETAAINASRVALLAAMLTRYYMQMTTCR
jgi:hypothetical protein